MRAAIYNPYLDTLGGGERYTISFAKVLADMGWRVDVEWKNAGIKQLLEKRFGLDSKNIYIVSDIKRGDSYDLCFWVSDGSIPMLKARKNFLHFQVPFHHIGGNNLFNKMKFIRIDKIICNSNFTKNVIDKEFGVESIVIYPPVDTIHINSKRKENIILSVGRFSNLMQNKHQDILIEAFKNISNDIKGWKLIIAGGAEIGVGEYISKLIKMSAGFPIEIIESPDYKTLIKLYGKAKIFWSAAGFGEDEKDNPDKVEHFGISVAEAMTGACVPVVYNAGGHKEIVEDSNNGFLWNNEGELIEKTLKAIKDRTILSKKATESGKKFAYERFKKEILQII